jgi:uncharacterized protein (UPF0335 family)
MFCLVMADGKDERFALRQLQSNNMSIIKSKFIESQNEIDKIERLERELKSIQITIKEVSQTIESISLTEVKTKDALRKVEANFELLALHSQNLETKTRTEKETKLFLLMVFSIFGIISLSFWGCSKLDRYPHRNNLPQVSTR